MFIGWWIYRGDSDSILSSLIHTHKQTVLYLLWWESAYTNTRTCTHTKSHFLIYIYLCRGVSLSCLLSVFFTFELGWWPFWIAKYYTFIPSHLLVRHARGTKNEMFWSFFLPESPKIPGFPRKSITAGDNLGTSANNRTLNSGRTRFYSLNLVGGFVNKPPQKFTHRTPSLIMNHGYILLFGVWYYLTWHEKSGHKKKIIASILWACSISDDDQIPLFTQCFWFASFRQFLFWNFLIGSY